MRVAYVCADRGVPVFGRKGCSVHVLEVVRALRRRLVDVDVFAARVEGRPPIDLADLRLHALPFAVPVGLAAREAAALDANEALRQALSEAGPFDGVYERHSLWSHAAMEYARATGTAGVLEVNAPLIEEQAEHRRLHDRRAAADATQRCFAAAGAIIAVSSEVARYVRGFAGVRGRVHVVPNGVDPDRFRRQPRRGVTEGADVFRVGFVGTLKPWHGVPVLIDAVALLHAEAPGIRLEIVGDGPGRARLAEHAQERGLTGIVHFTGAIDPEDVPARLATMDTAVAPYGARDGFYFSPLKILEYMAAGVPVVASRLGQIEEMVRDGDTGLLCPPDDPHGLADQLRLLRDSPRLRHRLAARARQHVERHHSWAEVTRQAFALAGVTLPAVSAASSPAPREEAAS